MADAWRGTWCPCYAYRTGYSSAKDPVNPDPRLTHMNSIQRYFPGFCDVDDKERVTVSFSTVKEMTEIPWVANWANSAEFDHFDKSGRHLMAILNKGHEWWVVGFIQHPELVDLPEWHAPKREPADRTVLGVAIVK